MTPDQHAILEELRSLPPNLVYVLAPKQSVIRGYEYFHQERLESLAWHKDPVRLIAVVQGTKRYVIEFDLEDEALGYRCTCPAWNPSSNCKHVVCAFLTLTHVLSPDHFKVAGHRPLYVDKLRAQFLLDEGMEGTQVFSSRRPVPPSSPDKTPDSFELVINLRHQYPEFSVLKHGKRTNSIRGMPSGLAHFLGDFFYSVPMLESRFQEYLHTHGNTYPLALETEAGKIPLRWEPSSTCRTHTELDGSEDRMTIRPHYVFNGVPSDQVTVFWDYAVDLPTNRLVRLENSSGLDLYDELSLAFTQGLDTFGEEAGIPRVVNRFFQPAGWGRGFRSVDLRSLWMVERKPLHFPLSQFHTTPLNLPAKGLHTTLQHLILKVDGVSTVPSQEKVPPSLPPPQYCLAISPVNSSRRRRGGSLPEAQLRAECWWGDRKEIPHGPTFGFFTYLEQARDLPAPLRTQKRKKVLYDTFFKLLALDTSSGIEGLLRTALSGGEFSRYGLKTSAKDFLRQFLSAFRNPELRLLFHKKQWHLLPIDKFKEAGLYRLPYEQFGPDLFREMRQHDEMTVPLEQLHQQLPTLYEVCHAIDIQLFYHAKPVTIPRWDFSLDVQHPEGIDWFELRPEIRCNGVYMSAEALHRAQQSGGVLETGNAVHLVPSNAREIFRALSSLNPDPSSGKQGNKEILRVPRLQILDWIALRTHGVRVNLPAEDEALLDRLTHFERMDIPPLPTGLLATLRPYQISGYAWLAFLYTHRFGACLADDMGLGKTLQAISLFGGIKEGVIPSRTSREAPHLVVLPPSLLFNWEQEIAKFYPSLRVQLYAGKERTLAFDDCDVVLTTYGLVRRDIARLEKIPFHLIVFDEAQAVKNIYAETTSAVRRLNGTFKMVMTGTPLENHLGEYFSLIDLCLPGLLGEYEGGKAQISSLSSPLLEVLARRTKPFVLRRTKEQVLTELPPKTETDVYLDLTERQKTLYQQTIEHVRPTIENAYRTKTPAQARIIALTAILKLRQVCLSPKLLHNGAQDSSPKIHFLLDRLTELMQAGHSALVFSQFTSFLNLVEEVIRAHEIPYRRLDGSTATGKRKKLVQGFQGNGQPSVFLLSLKAGGQGLNLTKASYVFHLDPWWNPAVENQASDRTHRIGQTQKVSVLRILMRHTIEEKMMDLKQRKLALYHAVMEGSTYRGTGSSITKSDFDFLLG